MFKKFKSALVGILTLSLLASSVAFAAPAVEGEGNVATTSGNTTSGNTTSGNTTSGNTTSGNETEKDATISSLTVNPVSVTVKEGEKAEVTVNVAVSVSGKEATITAESSDAKVATAAASGKKVTVTGVKEGTAKVTVTAKVDKDTKTVTFDVKVEKKNTTVEDPKPQPVTKKNVKAKDGSKVDTNKNGTATIKAVKAKKNAKSVSVPSKVVVDGVSYKVTKVAANAFKSVKKTVKSITIPTTVKTIEKNAFKGLTKLNKITMKVTKANAVSIKKGAFSGVKAKKLTIVVSKKMSKKEVTKLKKALKSAGYKKTVKVVKK